MYFSQTNWMIKFKFYVEPPWVVALKFCSQYLVHMTKMAAMHIYGKTLQICTSPEPVGRFPRNLVCIHSTGDFSPSLFDDPGMTLTYFTARSILEKSENSGCFGNYCSLRPETWQMQTTCEAIRGVRVFNVNVIS